MTEEEINLLKELKYEILSRNYLDYDNLYVETILKKGKVIENAIYTIEKYNKLQSDLLILIDNLKDSACFSNLIHIDVINYALQKIIESEE